MCELAKTEKLLDKLVEQVPKQVKNKVAQTEICKILQKLEQMQTALELGQIVLKPYTQEELVQLTIELEKQRGKDVAKLIQGGVPEINAGFLVPKTFSKWLWELSYEMEQLKLLTREQVVSLF